MKSLPANRPAMARAAERLLAAVSVGLACFLAAAASLMALR
jgi:hypothetical protein